MGSKFLILERKATKSSDDFPTLKSGDDSIASRRWIASLTLEGERTLEEFIVSQSVPRSPGFGCEIVCISQGAGWNWLRVYDIESDNRRGSSRGWGLQSRTFRKGFCLAKVFPNYQ